VASPRRRCLTALPMLALIAALAPASAQATCRSAGRPVIKQTQLVIYLVDDPFEYRGCHVQSGRVTRLRTGPRNTPEQIAAHGTHATLVESLFADDIGILEEKRVSIWDLRRGRVFRTRAVTPDAGVGLIDSPQGDPVTAIVYLSKGKRVLDVIYDRGSRRLSTRAVRNRSVTVTGRTVRWVEGGRRRSRTV
jgi:hypothetical protein